MSTVAAGATIPTGAAPIEPPVAPGGENAGQGQGPSGGNPVVAAGTAPGAAGSLLGSGAAAANPGGVADGGAGAQNTVPPSIEVKVPEGFEIAPDLLTSIKQSFQKGGVEGAQALVDSYAKFRVAEQEKFKTDHEARKTGWVEQIKADQTFGGQNFDDSVQAAKRVMQKFGTPELTEFLDSTGIGSHPALFKFVAAVGKGMGEDTIAGTAAAPSTKQSEEALLREMYPSMFKE